MRSQPNRNYVSNDDIQTPLALARSLVTHFQPTGRILEPCRGDGNFLRALREQARSVEEGARSREPRAESIQPKARSKAGLKAHRSPLPATSVHWTEVKRGRDFFAWDQPIDWIITNPPWSQIRAFLQHAMTLADHVVFLMTINHVWTKARLRDIREAGFGLKEIVLVDMPRTFPQSGFQLGAVHVCRGWKGPVTITDLGSGR